MKDRRTMGAVLLLVVLGVAGSATAQQAPPAAAPAPAPPTPPAPTAPDSDAYAEAWRDLWTTTHDQRKAEDPRARAAQVDVVVFPYPSTVDPSAPLPAWFAGRAPRPRVVAKGEPLRLAGPRAPAVWRVLPRTPALDEYLELRTKHVEAGDLHPLVRWCERRKLITPLLFETRQMLGGSPATAAYKRFNAFWQKHAGKLRAPYSFDLPVTGEWLVMPTPHHRAQHWSTFAVDLVMARNGRTSRGGGTRNTDFFAWGQPVVAQSGGVVVRVHDGTPDNSPGRTNTRQSANLVVIDYGGIRAMYAHFRRGSVKVSKGERVKFGQILGEVGNSGLSTAPHLHYGLEDVGGASIRGRFTHERRKGSRGKWKRVDGGDLKANTYVRNLPRAQRVPPRTR